MPLKLIKRPKHSAGRLASPFLFMFHRDLASMRIGPWCLIWSRRLGSHTPKGSSLLVTGIISMRDRNGPPILLQSFDPPARITASLLQSLWQRVPWLGLICLHNSQDY